MEENGNGRLTSRQLEVLWLIYAGYSNAEIAERLGIAYPTVRNHVNAVCEKMGVKGTEVNKRRILMARRIQELERDLRWYER